MPRPSESRSSAKSLWRPRSSEIRDHSDGAGRRYALNALPQLLWIDVFVPIVEVRARFFRSLLAGFEGVTKVVDTIAMTGY